MKPENELKSARVYMWLVEKKLPEPVMENVERISHSEDVKHVAIMPDVHLGRGVNNGTVIATQSLIYPQAVGADIGCGISAVRFNGTVEFLQAKHHAETILKAFYTRIPALKQRGGRQLPDSLRQRALSHEHLAKQSERDGSYQLGTLGCGNHFAELQEDDSGILWFMVHSGSRAMGQIITNHHLTQASLSSTGLQFLDSQSDAGQAYLNDMEWAQKYATLNRLAIMAQVAEILDSFFSLSVQEDSYLDCPHNFLRRENHFGTELLVHRKSAISAQSGEPGLVAGSMGTPSYIVRGQGFSDALCSSSHGAGRLLSRTEARKRISSSIMERQLGSVHYDQANLRTLRDEAPGVYRDLREVMRAQHDLTRQEIRLTPKLNFKYPDPHRD